MFLLFVGAIPCNRPNTGENMVSPLRITNCFAQSQEPLLYHDRQMMLGTFVEIISPDKDAIKTSFNEIRRLEDIFSKFKKNSDVYQLNQKRKIKAHPETLEITEKAKYFYRLTDGAFDITAQIGKKSHGLDKIIIDRQAQTIELKDPAINIDLGGIADGFIIDKVITLVKKQGINSILINAGGDIYCLGKKSQNRKWEVGIQNPYSEKDVLKVVPLENKAITTSGAYQQPGHIIDTKTGKSVESNIISASIVSDDCITADALATAVFVMGKDKSLKIIETIPGVEAYIYTKKDII